MDAVTPYSSIKYFRALSSKPSAMPEIWRHWNVILAGEPNGVELSSVMRSAGVAANAHSGRYCPPRFFEDMREAFPDWQAKITPLLPGLEDKDLTTLPLAFSHLRLLPPDDFMNAFETALRRRLPRLDFTRNVGLLLGYSKLGLTPPSDIHESLLEKTQQWIALSSENPEARVSMEFGQAAYTLETLALADSIASRPEYAQMAAPLLVLLRAHYAKKAQHIPAFNMVHDACEWFGLPHDDLPRSDFTNTVSQSEIRLREHFIGMRMRMGTQKDCWYGRLNKAADFMLINEKDRRFWVEFDGPHHFLVQPGTFKVAYDGATRFQSALMRRVNPERPLVRIPYMTLGLDADERRIRRRQLPQAFNALAAGQVPPGRALVLLLASDSHCFVPL